MTQPALHVTPGLRDVLVAQVRAVGFVLRGPAIAAAALAGVATVLVAMEVLRTGETIGFHPEHQMLPSLLGLLFPIAVWKGEERFGAGFLWTLPVDRRRHALAKVFAGWLWLMGALGVFVLWLLGFALSSGGSILAEETLRLLPPSASLSPPPLDLRALPTAVQAPQPLLWLVPFSAATTMYLLASAVTLGARRPLRWIVAVVLGLFLVVTIGHASGAEWLIKMPERSVRRLIEGPWGLDAVMTARTESLKIEATLSTGETIVVWRALPTLGQWATATLLWSGAGLLSLWVAASRHRERRRA